MGFAKKRQVYLETRSEEETLALGFRIAAVLEVPGVVLLTGPLGAGKTVVARGIAKGLGIRDSSRVHSPSFKLVNVYHGDCRIYHVDLYRLDKTRDVDSIGLEEFLGLDGLTLVEWGERLKPVPGAVTIEIKPGGENRRCFLISSARFPLAQVEMGPPTLAKAKKVR